MHRRWWALVIAGLSMPMVSLRAQFAELQPGTKVRVQAPAVVAGRLVGVVVARTADSITVTRDNASPVAIPLRSVTALDISRGKSRGRGAGKGALWGGGTSGLLFALIPSPLGECSVRDGRTSCEELGRAEALAVGAIGGAFWGAVIGAAIGAERWERASLPVTIGWAPGREGAGAQLRVHVALSR